MKSPRLIPVMVTASVMALGMAAGAAAQNLSAQEAEVRISIDMGGKVVMRAILEDSPTTRDLVSQLPLTTTFEDYASFEKIGYPPRKLSTEGAPEGETPSAGDVGYYAPWGNIALFHTGFRNSPGLILLGRIEGEFDALRIPGPVEVTIELVD